MDPQYSTLPLVTLQSLLSTQTARVGELKERLEMENLILNLISQEHTRRASESTISFAEFLAFVTQRDPSIAEKLATITVKTFSEFELVIEVTKKNRALWQLLTDPVEILLRDYAGIQIPLHISSSGRG